MAKQVTRSIHQTDDEAFAIEVNGRLATIEISPSGKLHIADLEDILAVVQAALQQLAGNPS